MKLIFTYLNAFSKAGGIEKFNRSFIKALCTFPEIQKLRFISLHDKDNSSDKKYQERGKILSYSGNKLKYFFSLFTEAIKSDIIIVGHLNIAPLILIIKLFIPTIKIIWITHGIEVWGDLSFLKKYLLKNAFKILAVSNFTKEKLVNNHKIPSEIIKIFPNTIDPYFPKPDKFEKSEELLNRYNLTSENKIIFTLCRISHHEKYKGYDRIIEALPEVLKKIPETKYLLSGKYTEEEKKRLDELIQKYEIKDKVIFTGFIAENELVQHFLIADLFAMPSVGEGFGIVFIEAIVCGLDIIAGNTDGSQEALDYGKLGTLINPYDIKKLSAGIINIFKNILPRNEKAKQEKQKKVYEKFGFDIFRDRQHKILRLP